MVELGAAGFANYRSPRRNGSGIVIGPYYSPSPFENAAVGQQGGAHSRNNTPVSVSGSGTNSRESSPVMMLVDMVGLLVTYSAIDCDGFGSSFVSPVSSAIL